MIEQQSSAVLLGQLAMERAATTAIRQFAQTIIADSARLNAELKRIALFRGVTFPGELNPEDRASYEYLSSLSGAEFDQGYVHHALRRGNAALAQFQDEAAHGAHPEIQRFAAETLATVREHVRLIQDTTSRLIVMNAVTTRAIGYL